MRIAGKGLALLLLLCVLPACAAAEGAEAIIPDMAGMYGQYGEEAADYVSRRLADLAAADAEAAEQWAEIMALWRRIDATEIHEGRLPEDLPRDDSLCLVALGFQLNPDGTMREELVRRLEGLLACAEQYPEALIACTGGGTASANPQVTEAGAMADWLRAHGVDDSRILTEDRSLTTAQNAMFTCRILRERYPQVSRLAIVSSDYHIATGTLLFAAECILRAYPLEVVSNAAWPAPSGSLSRMFQAGALTELSGDTETAFAIYYETYDIHPLPGRPAFLSFSSFDGGGFTYGAHPEDPELVSVTSRRDYGSLPDEPIDGAAFDEIFTFTGLKPGRTRVWIRGESPIIAPYTAAFALTVDDGLNVSLEPQRVLDRLEWVRGGEIAERPVTLFRIGTDYWLWQDMGPARKADPAAADAVMDVIANCGMDAWDGFSGDNPDVLDGSDFRLEITFADGTSIRASGENRFPEGYHEALTRILDILGEPEGEPLPIAGEYRYEGEGFGGDFLITLRDDGSYVYTEGYLSSYLGVGTWETENEALILRDAEDRWSCYVFIPTGDSLIYDGWRSSSFTAVRVPDGGRFFRTETIAETEEILMIRGSLGSIYGELGIPARQGRVPLIILSHGFGGTHAHNTDYAAYFRAQGFATYSFDFCGGGIGSLSEGALLEMTGLTEARDLNAIIDRFLADPRFSGIYLWGASQGGFVSSLVASQRPQDVAKLMIEFPAIVLQDDAKARANPDGTFPETSSVMGITIGRAYNEAAVSFDLYDLLPAYTGPVLILHGDRDPIVPLRYSERAAETFPNAELVVMPGQGHGFSGAARQEAMEREAAFFLK